MKVILLQDVAKIGKRSEVVEVPNGYALNQLIPKRMAEAATSTNEKRIDKLQADAKASDSANEAKFETAHKALSEKKIEISTEVNEKGHLFKAVSESDVVEAAGVAGIDVEAAMIVIASPIKEVGEHTLDLVRGDKKAPFTIEVVKK